MSEPNSAESVAEALNERLNPHGLKAKATLKAGYLQIVVSSATGIPKQVSVIPVIEAVVTELGLDSVRKLTVYGKSEGAIAWAWKRTSLGVNRQI